MKKGAARRRPSRRVTGPRGWQVTEAEAVWRRRAEDRGTSRVESAVEAEPEGQPWSCRQRTEEMQGCALPRSRRPCQPAHGSRDLESTSQTLTGRPPTQPSILPTVKWNKGVFKSYFSPTLFQGVRKGSRSGGDGTPTGGNQSPQPWPHPPGRPFAGLVQGLPVHSVRLVQCLLP